MIPWNDAYRRLKQSRDFAMLFGKTYSQDEFRPYSYGLRFDSLIPASLAATTVDPNRASLVVTDATIDAPLTAIVPGPVDGPRLIDFPAGAVILGVTATAQVLQRIVTHARGATSFTYGPDEGGSDGAGNTLFMLEFAFSDTDRITAGNPIPETVLSPPVGAPPISLAAVQSAPPIMGNALLGRGRKSEMPGHEIYVTPGLGLLVKCRSLLLPNRILVDTAGPFSPNLVVHTVFHCMIPGEISIPNALKKSN